MSPCFQFLAHHSCQKKLTSIWFGEYPSLMRVPWYLVPPLSCLLIAVYPVLAICYWLKPASAVCKLSIQSFLMPFDLYNTVTTVILLPSSLPTAVKAQFLLDS